MDRKGKLCVTNGRTMRSCALSACVGFVILLGCGEETMIGPDDPDPAEESSPLAPETADRILPEGSYDITLRACERCVPGSMPDYLLAFSGGVRATVVITAATESTASMEFVEMQRLGETSVDPLGLFAERIISLAWDGPEGVFRGFVEYGTAALFVASLRRATDGLQCGFDLVHLKHDVGATSCSVAD